MNGDTQDDGAMNPEHGARFVLERESAAADGAFVYKIAIRAPERTFGTHVPTNVAVIAPDGWRDAATGELVAPEPWMHQTANALWKTLRARHAAEPETGWPRRITRWRSHER